MPVLQAIAISLRVWYLWSWRNEHIIDTIMVRPTYVIKSMHAQMIYSTCHLNSTWLRIHIWTSPQGNFMLRPCSEIRYWFANLLIESPSTAASELRDPPGEQRSGMRGWLQGRRLSWQRSMCTRRTGGSPQTTNVDCHVVALSWQRSRARLFCGGVNAWNLPPASMKQPNLVWTMEQLSHLD